MRFASAVIAAAALLPLAVAECPKGCTGHGECDSFDACNCYSGFSGADCSERICPYGTAFADSARGDLNHDGVVRASTTVSTAYSKVQWSAYKQYEVWPMVAGPALYKGSQSSDIDPAKLQGGGWAAAADEAHFYAECSGKGACNRQTGACACFDGYEGGSCQRTTCPNGCSGHGTCTLVADVASGGVYTFADSKNAVRMYDGVLKAFTYNLWDAQKNTKCVCDAGYSGADCSLRLCPRGDDPLTVTNPVCGNTACASEAQGFTISSNSEANDNKMYRIRFFDYEGTFYFTEAFPIRTPLLPVNALYLTKMAANNLAIKNALERIPMGVTGNTSVSCGSDYAHVSAPNVRCIVTFRSLSGNLPEFIVEPVTGAPVIAQPSQPVHFLYSSASPAGAIPTGATAVQAFLFADDIAGFRVSQLTGVSLTTAAINTAAALKTAIETALQGTTNGPSAFVYTHGTTSASVAVVEDATSGASRFNVVIVMPSKAFGRNPIKLTIGTTTYTTVVDTHDGNMEASVCSNRGLCDYTSGLCKCFTGYTGYTCEAQNALAM